MVLLDTFKREWKKGSLLGRGAYGSVHKALCSDTGEIVAVKEILYLPDSKQEMEIVRACEEEIEILKVDIPGG
jgi:serine/threonine protein kinase